LDRAQLPPSLDDLAEIAERAMTRLPTAFREPVKSIPILIEEFPDEEVCREMDLESPFDILGLYQGVDLASKSVLDAPADLDRIFLYRRPILDYWCETAEELDHIVAHVLIHEIGHHFGLSDADMEKIEASVR